MFCLCSVKVVYEIGILKNLAKFHKTHRKTTVPKSLSQLRCMLQVRSFNKKRFQHRLKSNTQYTMFSTRNRFINKLQSRSLLNLGNTSRKPKILKERSNFFENCFLSRSTVFICFFL